MRQPILFFALCLFGGTAIGGAVGLAYQGHIGQAFFCAVGGYTAAFLGGIVSERGVRR